MSADIFRLDAPTRVGEQRHSWMTDALCAQTNLEVFFPEKGDSNVMAMRICGACDVREACLRFALETNQADGIWGGMVPKARRALRRKESK